MCRGNKDTYIICCPACFLPAPQHCWNPLLWVIYDPDSTRKTWPEGCLSQRWGSQCQNQCILTHCWSGPRWATQFWPWFFPLLFLYLEQLLSWEPISLLHNLLHVLPPLSSHLLHQNPILKLANTEKSRCRHGLPGQCTAGWSWHSSSQGILVPTIACRRHRVSLHISLAVHVL